MKLESRTQGEVQRRILTSMIVSRPVLSRISIVWDKEGLFSNRWCNLIGKWCVEFFREYDEAPNKHILDLFTSWAEDSKDGDSLALVDKFLSSLSEDYESLREDINPGCIIDLAGDHFNRVRLEKLADLIQSDLLQGDHEKADARVDSHRKVEIGRGTGIDVFSDFGEVEMAFAEVNPAIIQYSDALGEFYGNSLSVGNLIAFMGPQKRGKTWILIDLCWRAVLQRKRVAFFEVGDLTMAQMEKRLGVRAANRPLWSTRPDKPVRVPTSLSVMKGQVNVEFEDRYFEEPLSEYDVVEAFKKMPEKIRSNKSYLKLHCSAAGTMTLTQMKEILTHWDRETGWTPDVIIVDYADILAPPQKFYKERRDGINDNWIGLRALAAQKHCLVVTATQANAQSYKASTLKMHHFSEDNRKLSHVSGMIGLSAKPTEKEKGVLRMNWLVRREEESDVRRCVFIAGCLALGNPCILSSW